MMKKLLILAFSLMALGCGSYKRESVGGARDVLVFSEHRELVKNDVATILERQVFTPQPAPEFLTRYMSVRELADHLGYHGILFVGLDSDPVIKNNFPGLGSKDSFALYQIKDLWAKDQIVLVFVANDTLNIHRGLLEVRDKIREAFKYQLLGRMEAITYESGEDRKLTRRVEKYGFKLKIPRDWRLEEGSAAERFIWVHTHNPDRAIFVYWEDSTRKEITASSMVKLRDSLTALFYQKDYLNDTFSIIGPSYFRGYEAIRIAGVWQNDSMTIGGPMISYSFNAGGRFYMIDAMLFYPEVPRKKLFWLNQLEVILATFKPEVQA